MLQSAQVRLYPLPSSGRRRLAELRKQGMDIIEAKRNVITSLVARKLSQPIKAEKRIRSEESSPREKPIKKPKTKTEEKRFSEVAASEKVAIVSEGYPDVLLEQSKHEEILHSLINETLKVPKGTKIVLDRWNSRPGHILVSCQNKESANWVAQMVPSLKPWEGCSLKALTGRDLPKPRTLTTFIPFEFGKRVDAKGALQRIEVSNPGIDTGLWRIIGDKAEEKGQVVTFSVDEVSYKALQGLNMNPRCGFAKIKLRIRGAAREEPKSAAPVASTSQAQSDPREQDQVDPAPLAPQVHTGPVPSTSQVRKEPVLSNTKTKTTLAVTGSSSVAPSEPQVRSEPAGGAAAAGRWRPPSFAPKTETPSRKPSQAEQRRERRANKKREKQEKKQRPTGQAQEPPAPSTVKLGTSPLLRGMEVEKKEAERTVPAGMEVESTPPLPTAPRLDDNQSNAGEPPAC
ncbi:hypothetical protein O3M35_008351 [Rhynocoris fuscipes]|uniref:DUF4780 domain-containing protein n=1 Tax=Rhynocoris fuscipes TaxID=488301 RepID=A0AAW1DDE3_9HEMI